MTNMQKSILIHISKSFAPGSVKTELIGDSEVKVTDKAGESMVLTANMQRRIEGLSNAEREHELLWKIKDICKKHDVGKYAWRDDTLLEELDKALQSHYPKDLEIVRNNLKHALDKLNDIEQECHKESVVE